MSSKIREFFANTLWTQHLVAIWLTVTLYVWFYQVGMWGHGDIPVYVNLFGIVCTVILLGMVYCTLLNTAHWLLYTGYWRYVLIAQAVMAVMYGMYAYEPWLMFWFGDYVILWGTPLVVFCGLAAACACSMHQKKY